MHQEAEKQAKAWFMNREDLYKRPLETGFAIDPVNAKVIDDAISVSTYEDNRYRIAVHIADAGLIETSGAIAEQAWENALNCSGMPLLPPEIAVDKLSLGQDHYGLGTPAVTLAFDWSMDKRSIDNIKLFKSRLLCERLTLEQYQDQLYDNDQIRLLGQLATTIANPNCNGNKMPCGPEKAVATYMVITNRLIAREMDNNNVPWLYRNFINRRKGSSSYIASLGSQIPAAAKYSTRSKRHDGLNIKHYTDFASPLRKYVPFVNHQNLHALLNNEPLPYRVRELNYIAKQLAAKERYSVLGKLSLQAA